jgi:hypothetical protein
MTLVIKPKSAAEPMFFIIEKTKHHNITAVFLVTARQRLFWLDISHEGRGSGTFAWA